MENIYLNNIHKLLFSQLLEKTQLEWIQWLQQSDSGWNALKIDHFQFNTKVIERHVRVSCKKVKSWANLMQKLPEVKNCANFVSLKEVEALPYVACVLPASNVRFKLLDKFWNIQKEFYFVPLTDAHQFKSSLMWFSIVFKK